MPHHVGAPRTDLDGLADLAPLWKELHRHHRDVSDYRSLMDDLAASWERRLRWYQRVLADGGSYLTAVDEAGHPVGYAMVAIESGPDDTFESARGIAEVVTLVVARDQRSAGLGRALLRAAEGVARDNGFDTMKIAVMSGNARAQAFYEAHGYSIAEHVLYRHLSDD